MDYIEGYRPNLRVQSLTFDTTDKVPASTGTKVIEIKAPKGEYWRILVMTARAQVPTGGASGTHRIEIFSAVNDIYNKVTTAFNDWNAEIYMNMSYWKTAKAPIEPVSASDQLRLMQSVIITNDAPLYIKYSNLTNVEQDKPLIIRLVVVKELI